MVKKTASTKDKSIDNNKVMFTKDGYEKLHTELETLKTSGRKDIAERLADAISQGDLSENAEYDSARTEQTAMEMRIVELEDLLKTAEIIEDEGGKVDTIQLGSEVKLRFDDNTEHTFIIVGTTEADPLKQKMSNESPVGKELIGKKKGDKVSIKAPGGVFEYSIISIK